MTCPRKMRQGVWVVDEGRDRNEGVYTPIIPVGKRSRPQIRWFSKLTHHGFKIVCNKVERVGCLRDTC
jgi:hypothetical protein